MMSVSQDDSALSKIDLSKPRWSQDTYGGRAKHFFTVTNPFNLLLSSKNLEEARSLYLKASNHENLPPNTTTDDLWKAKYRYESAFHPDTKEKMFILGRMSAQVPMNMTITGCMMTFYRTTPAVLFWQWLNQSFNAIVNYTNRSGDAPISTLRLLTSYTFATTGAVTTALFLNSLTKKLPSLVGRYVPFAAVASANCINIPLMRSRFLEQPGYKAVGLTVCLVLILPPFLKVAPILKICFSSLFAKAYAVCLIAGNFNDQSTFSFALPNCCIIRELAVGIPITTASGEKIGESITAAKKAIVQVTTSRIGMALPGMAIPPIIMNKLAKGKFLKAYPWANAPIQVSMVGLCLVFATPLCCALFPQKSNKVYADFRPNPHVIQENYFSKKSKSQISGSQSLSQQTSTFILH